MDLLDYLSPARIARIGFLTVLGLLAIYIEAAPLGISAAARSSPDILLCVIAYWALRRPGSTPILLVFALGLARDLLTDVPVGAGTLSLVLAAEMLKRLRLVLARGGFLTEWLLVGLTALGTVAFQWLLVVLTLAQPPYLVVLGNQILLTAAVYPLVVIFLRWGLRITWYKGEVTP